MAQVSLPSRYDPDHGDGATASPTVANGRFGVTAATSGQFRYAVIFPSMYPDAVDTAGIRRASILLVSARRDPRQNGGKVHSGIRYSLAGPVRRAGASPDRSSKVVLQRERVPL